MNIVVLDGYTLNPGDLSWNQLECLGNTTVYDRTPDELIVERVKEADIILTNKTPLREKTLKLLPELKYIGVLATGYDAVDIAAAKERNIVVTNIPTYGTDSVAQLVFALLLELCHHVGHHSESVKRGEWSSREDWCYWDTPLWELSGKTIGIVGYGRIGRKTGEIAKAFGLKVIAYDPFSQKNSKDDGTNWIELSELLQTSDIVSLHCPLTPENEEFMNKKQLQSMKSTAILINTSRGKLINNDDLAEALNAGIIGGAGLDVLSTEPPLSDHPLLTAKNCIITPHMAWGTLEARSRLLNMAVENVSSYLSGKHTNVINIE
jgi:glycerate dehydrogenase